MQSNIGENARSPVLTKTIKRYVTQEKAEHVKAANGKERTMEEKQKTIYDLLDEVAVTMCDKFNAFVSDDEEVYQTDTNEIIAEGVKV